MSQEESNFDEAALTAIFARAEEIASQTRRGRPRKGEERQDWQSGMLRVPVEVDDWLRSKRPKQPMVWARALLTAIMEAEEQAKASGQDHQEEPIQEPFSVELVDPEEADNDNGRNGISTFLASDFTSGKHDIGVLVEGKGVYQGIVVLPGKFGITLPAMDLWAAPQDLMAHAKRLLNFKETVPAVAALDNWHGRSGVPLEDRRSQPDPSYEEGLYRYFDAVAKGEVDGKPGWVIPTIEMLRGDGRGWHGDTIVLNNLRAHSDKMPEGCEFMIDDDRYFSQDDVYFSCTDFATWSHVHTAGVLRSYYYDLLNKSNGRRATRLATLEPLPN